MGTTTTLRPVRFTFNDEATWDGLTDDTTWNGFLNVRVTPATRDEIVAHFEAEALRAGFDRDDAVGGIDELAVGADGYVDLGWGFCTTEIEED